MKPNTPPLFILATVLCAWCVPGRAEIIGYESFDYTDAESLTGADGGSFWDFRNAASARHSTKASAWSVAPGFSGGTMLVNTGVLFTSNYGVVRTYGGPDTAGENAGAVNNDSDAKKVYYRFTMTRGAGTNWCGVSSFDFGTERLFFGVFPDGTNQFSIYDQNTGTLMDLSTRVCATGVTYTLVAKVDYGADRVSLFVNPDLDAVEPATKTTIFNPTSLVATAAFTGTNWSTGLRLGSDGLTSWDDLTVATTWQSLSTYPVTSIADTGAGSLRLMTAAAASTGGRVTFPAFAEAGKVYAVAGNSLLRFARATPGTLDLNIPITGLQPAEKLEGIDFHPLTGELFGLGIVRGTASVGRLYRLNTATGVATQIGSSPFRSDMDANGHYGFDFLPDGSAVRVTISGVPTSGSMRVNPATGTLMATDTSITFHYISACAYDISQSSATLFAVSHLNFSVSPAAAH